MISPRTPLRLSALLLALAIALLAVGCGGDDGDNGATTGDGAAAANEAGDQEATTANMAEFIKRADPLCRKAGAKIQRELRPYLEGGLDELPKQAASMVNEVVVPGLETEVAELRALGLPADNSEEAEALLAALEEEIEEAKADPKAFILESEGLAKSEKLAQEQGFAACGGL